MKYENPITTQAYTLEIQAFNLFLALRERHSLKDRAYMRYERRVKLTKAVRRLERMTA